MVAGGVFRMLEVHNYKTAAARCRPRQTARYYFSILEWFILQNLRVKAHSGFRVNVMLL